MMGSSRSFFLSSEGPPPWKDGGGARREGGRATLRPPGEARISYACAWQVMHCSCVGSISKEPASPPA